MSGKRTRRSSARAERPARGEADFLRMRSMDERAIEATSPPELARLPAGFWRGARLVMPVAKEAISLRVDQDVLAWFRAQGPRYQSRINAVLRSYVAHAAIDGE